MSSGSFPTRAIFCIVIVVGLASICRAADSIGVAGAVVERTQLRSIAEESLDQAQLDPKDRVAILVEGDGPRALVENAFIDALQKRNFIPVTDAGTASEQSLHVYLLECAMRVRELDPPRKERTVSTELEIRTVKGLKHETRVLGTFRRVDKDTAQAFPENRAAIPLPQRDEGALQRLLTPFIVIGGAVLMVYLFFTVRS